MASNLQSPVLWKARNIALFLFLLVALAFFWAAVAYPERQIPLIVIAIGFVFPFIYVGTQYVYIARRARLAADKDHQVAFAFYSCELSVDGEPHKVWFRGWATIMGGRTVIFSPGRAGVVADFGAISAAAVNRSSRLYFPQLVLETDAGKCVFQVVSRSGTGFLLASESSLEDLRSVIERPPGSVAEA